MRTAFADEDEALVVAFAAFAVGAIESAHLVQAERARADAVAELAAATERASFKREMLGEILNAQEAERARVSRDLHDDVGQALTSVLLGLRLVESSLASDEVALDDARRRTDDVRALVADALRRARQLAFDLRPTVLDDVGLLPALERLAQDMTARGDTAVALPPTVSLPNGCRPRSRPSSTASCRRRSPTSPPADARPPPASP